MIPRILHHVWITPDNSGLPDDVKAMADTWRTFSPGLSYNFLNNDKIEILLKKYGYYDFYKTMSYTTEKSDLVRFLALYDQGGMYCDTDVEFVKDVIPLLGGYTDDEIIVAGQEPYPHSFGSKPLIGTAVILSTPENDFWLDLVTFLLERYRQKGNPCYTTGPGLLSWMKYSKPGVMFDVLAPSTFFPINSVDYNPANLMNLRIALPEMPTYTIHHWNGKNTWFNDIEPERLNDFVKMNNDTALAEYYG